MKTILCIGSPAKKAMQKDRVIIFALVLFAISTFAVSCCSKMPKDRHDISSYLPAQTELGIWKPLNPPQKYVGDDLYSYMDGGAVTYNSYGFRQLITQEYTNQNNKTITLEIFEMENASGAHGMYSFKTGKSGKKIAVGSDALLEDYYLNFWKGKYLVTLTGFDSDRETIEGLIRIAEAVDGRIDSNLMKP